eukprot:jgi/Mesvir1/16733/Mv15117-RA.1
MAVTRPAPESLEWLGRPEHDLRGGLGRDEGWFRKSTSCEYSWDTAKSTTRHVAWKSPDDAAAWPIASNQGPYKNAQEDPAAAPQSAAPGSSGSTPWAIHQSNFSKFFPTAPKDIKASVANMIYGVHHIGITVSDMETSTKFYTEVLPGTLIVQGKGFKGDGIHNILLGHEEAEGKVVPDLRNGRQLLDVAFIQFQNVIIELLRYYNADDNTTFPQMHDNTAPSYVNNMHISFYLADEVDPDMFSLWIEQESHARGMHKVQCNRTVRLSAPESGVNEHSFKVLGTPDQVGAFNGWTIIYMKGPDGEQLEFNHVTKNAKEAFAHGAAMHKEKLERTPLSLGASHPFHEMARKYGHVI